MKPRTIPKPKRYELISSQTVATHLVSIQCTEYKCCSETKSQQWKQQCYTDEKVRSLQDVSYLPVSRQQK